jgi:hypothetical protein
VVAPLATPNPATASRIILAAAAAGALQLVVRDYAKLYRQAFVSPVVELRTRDG